MFDFIDKENNWVLNSIFVVWLSVNSYVFIGMILLLLFYFFSVVVDNFVIFYCFDD